MKSWSSIVSSVSSFVSAVVSLACVAAAITRERPTIILLGLAGAHVAAALVGALGVMLDAPPVARTERKAFFFFAFAVDLLLPFAGAVGMWFVARLGLTDRRLAEVDPWKVLVLDEAALLTGVAAARTSESPSRIQALVGGRQGSPEERFHAVLQVKELPPEKQVPLLRLALRDSSEEVRLFAFSRIEALRSERERRIAELRDAVARATDDEQMLLHYRLAETEFEVAMLGLAEGSILEAVLDRAAEHAAEATARNPRGGAPAFLFGRILFAKGEHALALRAFQRAAFAYFPKAKVLPFVAECAFRLRRFRALKGTLRELAEVASDPTMVERTLEVFE